MAAEWLDLTPEVFFGAASQAPRAPRRHRTGWLFASVAAVVVAAAVLVGHALAPGPAQPPATLAAFSVPQRPTDVLDPNDASRLVVQPGSTRLLVRTQDGNHYAALSASGELCLIRVPDGDVPSEVCVRNRVAADVTIGGTGNGGQVRLVADGAPAPAPAEGWRPVGPNVWTRG